MFTASANNLMLDALGSAVTHLALHTAWSATGTNEVTGGSPAYARKAVTWAAAASSSKSMSGTVVFDVPGSSTTVAFVGLRTALTAGTHHGMIPLGGTGYKEVQVDTTANTIISEGHGFANGDQVVFLGGTAPGGLTEGTIYWVRDVTTDTFAVAATSGGAAIDLTSDGGADVRVSKIVPETFANQGTYTVSALTLTLA